MILGWFDARAAKAFGAELAVFYAEKIPVEAQVNEKKFAARTEAALKGLSSRVRDFRAGRKLGLYQKAHWATPSAGRCAMQATTSSTSSGSPCGS